MIALPMLLMPQPRTPNTFVCKHLQSLQKLFQPSFAPSPGQQSPPSNPQPGVFMKSSQYSSPCQLSTLLGQSVVDLGSPGNCLGVPCLGSPGNWGSAKPMATTPMKKSAYKSYLSCMIWEIICQYNLLWKTWLQYSGWQKTTSNDGECFKFIGLSKYSRITNETFLHMCVVFIEINNSPSTYA